MGFFVADLGCIEIQLINRLGIAIALFHVFPVQRNLNLIGVNRTGSQLGIGSGNYRQGEGLRGHVQTGSVQIGDNGGRIVAGFRIIIVGKIRVIADLVLNQPQESIPVVQRQHKLIFRIEIQQCFVVLIILRRQQQSVSGIGLVFQPDTDMQVALADRVGNEGELSVRKLRLGKLLGLQGRVNTGRIVFLAAAAVIAAVSAVVPIVAAGAAAVVAGILRTTLVVV